MTNEELAGVDELVGRLRQPNECERWLFSVPFEAADMLQSLIATAGEAEALRAENARLREALFNAIALIGHSVPMDATALVAGELLTAHGVWHQGRAALEQGEVK